MIQAIHGSLREKRIQRFLNPGLRGSDDFISSQANHNKRLRYPAPISAPEPEQKPTPVPIAPTLRPEYLNDRLHKWSSVYVVVSKDHNPGEDSVLNPGYKSNSVTASTINDGYNKALALLALLPAGKRVVLQIWGGYWAEDLTITSSLVDIEGIGVPVVLGKITVDEAAKDVLVRGVEFSNSTNLLALEVEALVSTLTIRQDVIFSDCWFHTPVTAVWVKRPMIFHYCTFYSDATSVQDPVVICQWSGAGWSSTKNIRFYICRVFATDLSGTLTAMKGCAIFATSTTVGSPPNYAIINALGATSQSGWVYLEDSTVRGWCRNEGWNMWFSKCMLFAGKRVSPDAGGIWDIFSFANGGVPVEGVGCEPRTVFDKCYIACRYIQEGNGDSPVNVWIRDTTQTRNGGAPLGSTCWNNILNLYGAPAAMNVYTIGSSRSWRAQWYFVGVLGVPPNEGALTLLGGTETFVHPNDILGAPAASFASSLNPTP